MKKLLLLMIFSILIVSNAISEEFIPLSSPIYDYLLKLEAEGCIKTGQLTTLPISKTEAKRLLKEAEETSNNDLYLSKLISRAQYELGEKDLKVLAKFDYLYTESKSFFADTNNNGVEWEKGHNLKIALPASYSYENFGFQSTPYFLSNESYENINFEEIYFLAKYKKTEVTLGKQSQWWGGGRRGSLLLSNNAEALNVFKISNSTPYDILIPFRFTFFITKLENNRTDIKSPFLQGIRVTIKPAKYLEIGLSKTGMYGGKGRDSDFGAFLDSLVGNKEKNTTSNINKEPGDQRAGFDIKLTYPNKIQPFTLYFEAIGEDVNHDFPYPYKLAYIYSLYLPRILKLYNLEFLVEYATTTYKQKRLWYNHHIFTQGYTYNGEIIGHYIGADAKDLFVKATYNWNNSKLDLSYEHFSKDMPDFVWENYVFSYKQNLLKNFSYGINLSLAKEDKDKFSISTGLEYRF